eukprot:CAMPEP_0175087912 /NCGR_PEP_ID=MMETSP0052_2-20121109/30097_1 /TAXON_ID=51329 ORGANISM="Polytomella parva, Strain SAG 63-3" /NCGR_SAMPLE_ID=MMETSP0052_2 /ASSEMBLY_ACC=CAM_ASM_000194 /LENGTH=109 /DNA_ID=CAMNT_0016360317 /DNA_START=457 /DNA_END=786 /DNA_ORIENTATION=+
MTLGWYDRLTEDPKAPPLLTINPDAPFPFAPIYEDGRLDPEGDGNIEDGTVMRAEGEAMGMGGVGAPEAAVGTAAAAAATKPPPPPPLPPPPPPPPPLAIDVLLTPWLG